MDKAPEGASDRKDKAESRKIAIILASVLVLFAIVLVYISPNLISIVETHFSPGVGFKQAALISFVVSIIVLCVLAVFSGDGLLGELQFMLPGFFAFFLLNLLLIAWVF